MSLIAMKEEVIKKFGEGSFEAGYIQHCYTDRDTGFFIEAYARLMNKEVR